MVCFEAMAKIVPFGALMWVSEKPEIAKKLKMAQGTQINI